MSKILQMVMAMAYHVYEQYGRIHIDDMYMGTHRIDPEVLELISKYNVRIIVNEHGVVIEPIRNN